MQAVALIFNLLHSVGGLNFHWRTAVEHSSDEHSYRFSSKDLYRNERNGIILFTGFLFYLGTRIGDFVYGLSAGTSFLFPGFFEVIGGLFICFFAIWGGGFLFFSLRHQWEEPGSEESMWTAVSAVLCFSPIVGFFGFPFSQATHVVESSLHLFLRDMFFLLSGISIGVVIVGVIHNSYQRLVLE